MARTRFLNFLHFVAPDRDGWDPGPVLVAGCVALGLSGCVSRPAPAPTEESLTSGRISVVCAPEAWALMSRERDAFVALYPEAHIRMVPGLSRAAVDSLFGARADLAVITRELAPEERQAAQSGHLGLEGFRFARDGVVVVVHPGNPVENMALEDLRGIYAGRLTRWSQAGGPERPVVPVVQPAESDITSFFAHEVMNGESMQAHARYVGSDSAAVAAVESDRDAVGFVSLAWSGRGAKTLRVSPLTGLAYVQPDLEAVYKGEYPLTRFFNLYLRSDGPPLAGGFVTFVTSRDGQRLVQEAGLVPTTVPVRFVRRSPMLGSH